MILRWMGFALSLPTALNSTSSSRPQIIGPDRAGKYWIYGQGISAAFIPYGASITDLIIKDRDGIERDLVMGFDNATQYEIDPVHPHLGGVPGRYANRIKNSTFEIDGVVYHITPNEHKTPEHPEGLNTLHGGPDGWDYRKFEVVYHTNTSIGFKIVDPDGKEGFPGEVISYITYSLGDMTWDAKMVASATTKKTPIMLTSHTYWNLDGFSNPTNNTILNHTLYLPYSSHRIEVDNILIPTGEILPNTKGSVNDFWSQPKKIGDGFNDPEIHGNCGWKCIGYGNALFLLSSALPVDYIADRTTDNCFLINRQYTDDWQAVHNFVASLYSADSGIRLDIYSDQAAFQMYSCGGQDGTFPLKKTQGYQSRFPVGDKYHDTGSFGRFVPKYGCVVLEVQDWIDGINHPEWGRTNKQIFDPDTGPYVLNVRHKFSVDKGGPLKLPPGRLS